MATMIIPRPDATEYVPYFHQYISKVPDGSVLELLARQIGETEALLGPVSDADGGFRYGEGKWSIKQVVGHLADTERIFVYRALCFARGDTQPLPGFEEDEYVRRARFDARTLADLVAEFRAVRDATVPFFAGLNEEELARRGVANQREYTVRAIAYIVAGHERHHVALLRERYLPLLRQR